ncbi:MAG: hypothetical protein CVU56_18385 [Deltaproteobacteria bacterium HGW-Deltaproteobacteria-14]|nr:MAG: hypothetical protein CVU56_18385 [Deltaproteobacteria bacterium HGW-Deltaproteobacteria-14]
MGRAWASTAPGNDAAMCATAVKDELENANGYPKIAALCVTLTDDVTAGTPSVQLVLPAKWKNPRGNHPVYVLLWQGTVSKPKGLSIAMKNGGRADGVVSMRKDRAAGAADDRGGPWVVARLQAAPGDNQVDIRFTHGDPAATTTIAIPLFIAEEARIVLRVGVGLGIGSADRIIEEKQQVGSGPTLVRYRTTAADVQPELVAGVGFYPFAPLLTDETGFPCNLGIYLGAAVAGSGKSLDKGVDWLNGLYVGLELPLSLEVSIAVAYRMTFRQDFLAEDVHRGAWLERYDGSSYKVIDIGHSLGVVLNFSPSWFLL